MTQNNINNPPIDKTISWLLIAIASIKSAGGNSETVLSMFPPHLLNILIRNDIHLVHREDK